MLVLGAGLLVAWTTGFLALVADTTVRNAALTELRQVTGRPWAGPGFVIAYASAVAVGLPASVLTLLGGAAFGLVHGVIWVTLGANLGANIAFRLSRTLGREALERVLAGRLEAFDRWTAAGGFQGLLVLRLLPVVPFSLLNFAAGLTPIPWPAFAGATALGILPGTLVYVFFADSLLAGSVEASRSALLRALVAGGLLIGFSQATRWLLGRRSPGRS